MPFSTSSRATPDASLLKDGGRLASPLGAAGEGPGRFNVMAEPTPANLERLAELLEAGTLRVPIQRSYQLEQAGEALQALPAHTPKESSAYGLTSANGANGIRTRDLLAASQTLSQLSYGPARGQV